MRTLRGALIGALSLPLAMALPAFPAAAAPAAPYNVFTADGLGIGLLADATNGSIEEYTGGSPASHVFTVKRNAEFGATVTFVAPLGGDFAANTSYDLAYYADASHPAMLIQFHDSNPTTCRGPGTLRIHDYAAGVFAASYSISGTSCSQLYGGPQLQGVGGEFRFNSNAGYGALSTQPSQLYFGEQLIGVDGTPQTVTFTSAGTSPVSITGTSIGGTHSGAYSVTGSTCTGITLSPGGSCTVTVTPHPTLETQQVASLIVATDTPGNQRVLWLGALGLDPRKVIADNLYFGDQQILEEVVRPTRVHAIGPLGVTLGTAFILDSSGAGFSIVDDQCSGRTLASGATCDIYIKVKPSTSGGQSAGLYIPTNSLSPYIGASLMVNGIETHSIWAGDVDFGNQIIFTEATRTLKVNVTGSAGATLGTASISGPKATDFSIVNDPCSGKTLPHGGTCSISIKAKPSALGTSQASLSLPNNSSNTPLMVALKMVGTPNATGSFIPVGPIRILDTRTGKGAPAAPIGPSGVLHLQISGQSDVPAAVSAVVLNVTVTEPSKSSYLTVYPSGESRPTASTINFPAGWTGANSVTVKVGSNGKVDIFNLSGNVEVIADVVGYYSSVADAVAGSLYIPSAAPMRIFDSRRDLDRKKLPSHWLVRTGVNFGDDNLHVTGYAVTVTAVNPDKAGYLTAWSGDGNVPNTSTLNFNAGRVVPNFAVIPASSCRDSWCGGSAIPTISVYNGSSGAVHVVVDVVGVLVDSSIPGGLRFNPSTPTRILDTRNGFGGATTLGAGAAATVPAPASVLTDRTAALAMNVTAVAPTDGTYLTVWPAGQSRPTASNLNPAAGQTVANAAITRLGLNSGYSVFNFNGSTNVVIDVVGSFEADPVPGFGSSTFLASGPGFGAGGLTFGPAISTLSAR